MAASDLPLSADDRATLSMRSDEFHVALARGAADDWSQFLEGLTGDVRLAVLIELAIVELGHRYETGEQPTLEDYTDRFPELGPPGDEPAADRGQDRVMDEGVTHRAPMGWGSRVTLTSDFPVCLCGNTSLG